MYLVVGVELFALRRDDLDGTQRAVVDEPDEGSVDAVQRPLEGPDEGRLGPGGVDDGQRDRAGDLDGVELRGSRDGLDKGEEPGPDLNDPRFIERIKDDDELELAEGGEQGESEVA